MKTLLLVFTVLLLNSNTDSVWVKVNPTQGFEPLNVVVTIHIAPNEDNRKACLILYGDSESRVSCWDIHPSDLPTKVNTKFLKALPAGNYMVQVVVNLSGGKVLRATPVQLFVSEVEF